MSQLQWKRLNEYEPKPVQFLWSNRIPLGAITILEGDPGTGKSTILADIGARVTSGAMMPLEDTRSDPAGVVLLSGEESIERVASSYRASGGDLSRVLVLDRQSRITLPLGMNILRAAVETVDARLLLIDPVTDFLGININHDQAVRSALGPLSTLAAEKQLAVVLVRHLTKSSRSKAVYAGGGSIAFAGVARSVLLVGTSPTDTDQHILAVSKSNVAPPSSIAYSIEGSSSEVGTKVQWRGHVETTSEELLDTQSADSRSQLEEAQLALYRLLESGPLGAKEVFKLATGLGISRSTLKRAKRILGIKTVKRGFGAQQTWWWCLPRDSELLNRVKDRIVEEVCDELFGGSLLEDDVNSPG